MNKSTLTSLLPYLVLAATGTIAYFLIKDKENKDKAGNSGTGGTQRNLTSGASTTTGTTVGQQHILSDAEIKKYATWIDRLEQLTTAVPYAPDVKQLEQSAEAKANLTALLNLDDYNLRLVVKYWENARKRSISAHLTFSGFTIDVSGLVAQFKNRI